MSYDPRIVVGSRVLVPIVAVVPMGYRGVYCRGHVIEVRGSGYDDEPEALTGFSFSATETSIPFSVLRIEGDDDSLSIVEMFDEDGKSIYNWSDERSNKENNNNTSNVNQELISIDSEEGESKKLNTKRKAWAVSNKIKAYDKEGQKKRKAAGDETMEAPNKKRRTKENNRKKLLEKKMVFSMDVELLD